MIEQEQGEFNGLACRWFDNGRLRLAVTTAVGPRVVFCGVSGGPNLLAETPEVALEGPHGPVRLLGGHRLWYGPEIAERTYWPDDQPVTVEALPDGARFIPPPDAFGIVKELTLTLDEEVRVTVGHTVRNRGDAALELAPWALTMVPLGGVALLPQPYGPVDAGGLLPNRFLTLWPYSDPLDPRLCWGQRIILLRGDAAPPNKLGYRNVHGWLAHWFAGTLLVKEFAPQLDRAHPDNGCNAECYVNARFMEVESLGALTTLQPGEAVAHDETWRFYEGIDAPADEGAAVALATHLGLL